MDYLGPKTATGDRLATQGELGGSSSAIPYAACLLGQDFTLPASMSAIMPRSFEIALLITFEIGLGAIYEIT